MGESNTMSSTTKKISVGSCINASDVDVAIAKNNIFMRFY